MRHATLDPYETAGIAPLPTQHGEGKVTRRTVTRETTLFVTADGEPVTYDPSDPASIEAMFGSFGFVDHWRKVVLASARELERAKAAAAGVKVTEALLDDKARCSDRYVSFLLAALHGRVLRESNVLESNNGR